MRHGYGKWMDGQLCSVFAIRDMRSSSERKEISVPMPKIGLTDENALEVRDSPTLANG